MKTGIQNNLSYLLKRTEKLEDFQFFMGLYVGKRNKYALVPQARMQGDRKRQLIRPEDSEVRDAFLTQPVDKVEMPEDLLLIVGTILLEADVSRGTAVLKQIRRQFISVQNDEEGKAMVAVRGNVRRKTNAGNSKLFKPMDLKVRGEYEVGAIRKLLDTLPDVGCFYCSLATPAMSVGEHPKCVCDKIFLHQREVMKWRSSDRVWFARQKWSNSKIDQLTALASKKAGTARVYTNSSIRPTNMTSYTLAGFTPDQMAHSFNLQKNHGQQEKYKRLGELMDDDEKRIATMVNTASGRTFLRGGENKFGSVVQKKNPQKQMYDRFKNILAKEMSDVEKMSDSSKDTAGVEGGDKVFAKIRGFPAWPAELVERDEMTGKSEVFFQDGSLGKNASTTEFTQENFVLLLKSAKFKSKSGSGSKRAFVEECEEWGLAVP